MPETPAERPNVEEVAVTSDDDLVAGRRREYRQLAAEQQRLAAGDPTPIGAIRRRAAQLYAEAAASSAVTGDDARIAEELGLAATPDAASSDAILAVLAERVRRQRGRAAWERRRAAAERFLADNFPSDVEATHRRAAVLHDDAAETHDRVADLIERQYRL